MVPETRPIPLLRRLDRSKETVDSTTTRRARLVIRSDAQAALLVDRTAHLFLFRLRQRDRVATEKEM